MREAARYERLARLARDRGFSRATAAGVQEWVKFGLIPLADVEHVGFQERRISEPAETERLLVEVCRRRYGPPPLRDLARIALGMWLDDFPVPDRGVRRGLVAAVDVAGTLRRRSRAADADGFDLANRLVFEEGLGVGEIASPVDLAAGMGEFIQHFGGEVLREGFSSEGIAALERMSGGSGLYRSIVEAGRAPIGLDAVLPKLTFAELTATVGGAHADQLVAAREAATSFRDWIVQRAGPAVGDRAAVPTWLERLERSLRTDQGLGMVVVALLANPSAQAALGLVKERMV